MLLAYASTSYFTAAMPTAAYSPSYCAPALPSAVYADMHDSDQKRVTTNADGTVIITPFGNDETWSVVAAIDRRFCNATIDFNVPGKPNPPPCNLSLSFEQLLRPHPSMAVGALVFTDPSEPPPTQPSKASRLRTRSDLLLRALVCAPQVARWQRPRCRSTRGSSFPRSSRRAAMRSRFSYARVC